MLYARKVRELNRHELDIEALLTPVVASQGCEIWGVEYVSQGRHSRLRIYIDKEDGITVEDCEKVSRQVGDVLDVADTVTGAYTLEVSSPGMDRILFKPEQFSANTGETVDIRLHLAFEGQKHFVGVLAAFENDEAFVHVGEEEYVFPIENVQRARIVPRFD
jgi:ribosome maturation factor RimP